MSYPTMVQIRHSTVLVVVLVLMGSVLYEVTKTESFPRTRAAARTQDIALAATQPQTIEQIAPRTHDYIGGGPSARAAVQPLRADEAQAIITAGGVPSAAFAGAVSSRSGASTNGSAANFGSSRVIRSGSSSGGGFSAGSFGMGGVGAWGGASGQARPARAAAATTPRAARAARPAQASQSSNARVRVGAVSSGGGAPSAVSWTQLEQAGGFTTGAAAVQAGAVVPVAAAAAQSPGAVPAATPEPMSMLLVASGLLGVYGVRRRFQ